MVVVPCLCTLVPVCHSTYFLLLTPERRQIRLRWVTVSNPLPYLLFLIFIYIYFFMPFMSYYFPLPTLSKVSKHVNPISDISLVWWAIGRDMYRGIIYLQGLVSYTSALQSTVLSSSTLSGIFVKEAFFFFTLLLLYFFLLFFFPNGFRRRTVAAVWGGGFPILFGRHTGIYDTWNHGASLGM